uniref:Uncharacterized protein n=1 Tax=Populus trichocarpa TaxID=3694 RepID=A0A2K1Y737_POPTR
MTGRVVGLSSLCFFSTLFPSVSVFSFYFSWCCCRLREWWQLEVVMMVANRGWLGCWSVAVEAGNSSCFLFPSAEALLLLLVSFVSSVNAVLPSLQQLHGGAVSCCCYLRLSRGAGRCPSSNGAATGGRKMTVAGKSKCRLFFQWCSAGWDEDDELRKEVGSVDEEEWQRFQE